MGPSTLKLQCDLTKLSYSSNMGCTTKLTLKYWIENVIRGDILHVAMRYINTISTIDYENTAPKNALIYTYNNNLRVTKLF